MLLTLRLRQIIQDYIRDRIFLVALVLILLSMGIAFGVIAASVLEKDQQRELVRFVNQGLHGEDFLQSNIYARQTVVSNLQTVFFLFFMGISVIGVPLALLLIFARGFILGFSTGFLFQTMGYKGILLTLTGILPHNIIVLPALLIMVVAIMDCAAALTKIRFTKKQIAIGEEMIRCAVITLIVILLMVLGGFVQGYVTPFITTWVGRII
ncbi:stage II sporulation protein M [Hydrogenispora ethanolica]|nr:stage II sporulation protein M [Hydrogenispora ethanolica]